ncbi:MAG TPA: fused MFS/spermidine synthase, partial [Magnetococcales bacterium]|nr:fused MFS/spermidine synthase [Magnetococcales bacterium]
QGQTIDVVDEVGGTRAMYFMSRLIQSRMDPTDPLRLVLPYSRHMMASLLLLDTGYPKTILMIGLGGGSLAKFILHHFPEARLVVVEVDEGMESLARTFFGLPQNPRLTIHIADGAIYMHNASDARYDLILVDAFNHDGMAPTVYARQFFMAAKKLVTPTGVIAVNMSKSEGTVYNEISKTLKTLFPNGLLRLPVRASRNEILLCCARAITQTDWERGTHHAKTLEPRLSLEFGQFLGDMRRSSSPFWSRGINF